MLSPALQRPPTAAFANKKLDYARTDLHLVFLPSCSQNQPRQGDKTANCSKEPLKCKTVLGDIAAHNGCMRLGKMSGLRDMADDVPSLRFKTLPSA